MSGDAGLADAIDAFLLELRVERGLSPLTVAAYRRDLAQFAAHAGGDRAGVGGDGDRAEYSELYQGRCVVGLDGHWLGRLDGRRRWGGLGGRVVNVGGDDEVTILDLAELVLDVTGSASPIVRA